MDFTNLNNEYVQYWSGQNTAAYVSQLVTVGNYLNQAGVTTYNFNDQILEPETLYYAVLDLTGHLEPETVSYSQLYDDFTLKLFQLYESVITDNSQPSWIITGLKNAYAQISSFTGTVGGNLINALSFLSNPFVIVAIIVIVLIILFYLK